MQTRLRKSILLSHYLQPALMIMMMMMMILVLMCAVANVDNSPITK